MSVDWLRTLLFRINARTYNEVMYLKRDKDMGQKVKIKPADSAFSKCIRAANNYQCKKCGAQHDKSSMGLHNSHTFSRRHRTIRWCKENGTSLCFSCHSWYGGNPMDSAIWMEELVGIGVIERLREKMNSGIKVSKRDEGEIAKWYREQLKFIEHKRELQPTGYIDFESWQ